MLIKLCTSLEHTVVLRKDFVIVEGELGKEMFIIETGMCEVSVTTPECQHARGDEVCTQCVLLGRQGPKSFFGELAVMGVAEWQRRKRSVRAKTNCNLSVLCKDVLDDLRYDYPELNAQLFKVASGVQGAAGSDGFSDEHITHIDEMDRHATRGDIHALARRIDGMETKLDHLISVLGGQVSDATPSSSLLHSPAASPAASPSAAAASRRINRWAASDAGVDSSADCVPLRRTSPQQATSAPTSITASGGTINEGDPPSPPHNHQHASEIRADASPDHVSASADRALAAVRRALGSYPSPAVGKGGSEFVAVTHQATNGGLSGSNDLGRTWSVDSAGSRPESGGKSIGGGSPMSAKESTAGRNHHGVIDTHHQPQPDLRGSMSRGGGQGMAAHGAMSASAWSMKGDSHRRVGGMLSGLK